MISEKQILVLVFVLVFNSKHLLVQGDCTVEDNLYAIVSNACGLVVASFDPSFPSDTVVHTRGETDGQGWKIERLGHPGLFHIINNFTGLALDIENCTADFCNVKCHDLDENSMSQQWFIGTNSKITNAMRFQNLDITYSDYKPGAPLGVWKDGDYPNQEFTLELIESVDRFRSQIKYRKTVV